MERIKVHFYLLFPHLNEIICFDNYIKNIFSDIQI